MKVKFIFVLLLMAQSSFARTVTLVREACNQPDQTVCTEMLRKTDLGCEISFQKKVIKKKAGNNCAAASLVREEYCKILTTDEEKKKLVKIRCFVKKGS